MVVGWAGFGASSVRARLFDGSEQSRPLHSHPEMQIALHQSFTLGFQRTKWKWLAPWRELSLTPPSLCLLSLFVTGSFYRKCKVSSHIHSQHSHICSHARHVHPQYPQAHTPLGPALFPLAVFDPVSHREACNGPCFKLGWAAAIKDIPAGGVFRPDQPHPRGTYR